MKLYSIQSTYKHGVEAENEEEAIKQFVKTLKNEIISGDQTIGLEILNSLTATEVPQEEQEELASLEEEREEQEELASLEEEREEQEELAAIKKEENQTPQKNIKKIIADIKNICTHIINHAEFVTESISVNTYTISNYDRRCIIKWFKSKI